MKAKRYLCGWSFDYKNQIFTEEEFNQLTINTRNVIIDTRLNYLLLVLDTLALHQILIPNRVEAQVYGQAIIISSSNLTTIEIIDCLKDNLKQSNDKNHYPLQVTFFGVTNINLPERTEEQEQVIDLSYSLLRNGIEINNHSDLWSPMDLDENYQIDIALLNNHRLENCLKAVKALGEYSYICPDEEEFGDEELPQYGFRILVPHADVLERGDFPKGREEDIKKFMWQYLTSELST